MRSAADAYDELIKTFEREVNLAKKEVVEQERNFSVMTGARLAVGALSEAGAFKDECAWAVSQWLEDGGAAHLLIGGVMIVPPKSP